MTQSADLRAEIDRIYREEYGRVVASLARRFGDLDIAEDAAAEALLTAIERWPADGIPPNPGGWLTTTAGNRAIDRIRRESLRDTKHKAAMMITDDTPHEPTGPVEDDRLRLVFTCCHPALAPEARVALTLRLLGGLTVEEIARAFLVPETTMAQRITRAKAKIKAAHIPYRVPDRDDVTDRLGAVLAVIYLVFNEGYLAGSGADPVRAELTAEAIRLGRILPAAPARRGRGRRAAGPHAAQRGPPNGPVRRRRARDTRRAGPRRLGSCAHRRGACASSASASPASQRCRRAPAPTRSWPPINAVHTDTNDARDTDWAQIVALYDQLYAVTPTPDRRAQPRRRGRRARRPRCRARDRRLARPRRAITPGTPPAPTCCDAWVAAPRRAAEYDAAIAATENPAETAYLARRRAHLVDPDA